MGKQRMDNISWQEFDPQAQKILLSTLRLLISSASALTVLIVFHERLAQAPAEPAERGIEAVEQLLRASLRRTDVVLPGGSACCAALLMGADEEGACCVVRRLHRVFTECPEMRLALSLGWASTAGPEHEAEMLVALALERRRPFVPVADELLFTPWKAGKAQVAAEGHLGAALDGRVLARATRQSRARKKLSPAPGVEPPERAVVVQARARALELGVPYLSPPQHIPSSVRKLVPPEVMRQYRCLPVGRDRNALTVALADPTDAGALSHLEQVTGLTIFPVMTDPEALEHLARLPRSRRPAQESPQI